MCVQWSEFGTKSSSLINPDSRTGPALILPSVKFTCSPPPCVGFLRVVCFPPTCKPGGLEIMSECDCLCVRTDELSRTFPSPPPVHSGRSVLPWIEICVACAAAFCLACFTVEEQHTVSILSIGVFLFFFTMFWGSLFLTALSDLFTRCFTCQHSKWEVRCDGEVVLIDW